MQALGWQTFGLEPDPRAVEAARKRGLDVELGVLDESSFAPASFDAVTLNHVIEHLHDPVRTLRICRRILRPGGMLWLATPNLGSLGHARFGPAWRGLEPPRHLVLFTVEAARRALNSAGFEREATLLRGVDARWMFRASERLRTGSGVRGIARIRLKWQARRADRQVRLRPDAAEEIVLLVRAS
jgi:predicted SAM-dependent methyltransferase